jgi:hypothetical protein
MKKYYLILSEGAYSDYTPTYFVGDEEITEEEFTKVGKQIGDLIIEEWENYPERKHICNKYCYHFGGVPISEKYDPENPKRYIGHNPDSEDWFNKMKEWILQKGFEELPKNIPELNSQYSEFPNNKTI